MYTFCAYNYDDPQDQAKALADFEYHIEDFIKELRVQFKTEEISLWWSDIDTIDLLKRFKSDIQRRYGKTIPNIYRQASFMAFWIKKLKPILMVTELPDKDRLLINETFALFVSIGAVMARLKQEGRWVRIPTRLLQDIVHQFRYDNISPGNIALVFEALGTVTSST